MRGERLKARNVPRSRRTIQRAPRERRIALERGDEKKEPCARRYTMLGRFSCLRLFRHQFVWAHEMLINRPNRKMNRSPIEKEAIPSRLVTFYAIYRGYSQGERALLANVCRPGIQRENWLEIQTVETFHNLFIGEASSRINN